MRRAEAALFTLFHALLVFQLLPLCAPFSSPSPSFCNLSDLPPLEDPDLSWEIVGGDGRLSVKSARTRQSFHVTYENGGRAGGGDGPLQSVVKACRHRKNSTNFIVDATLGLGGDSYVLASSSLKPVVLGFERDARVFHLSLDGLRRARSSEIVDSLAFKNEDSRDALIKCIRQGGLIDGREVDVVYIDVMFEKLKKNRSKAKKGMEFLRNLLSSSDQTPESIDLRNSEARDLLSLSLRVISLTKGRVVVKRERGAPDLGVTPSFVVAENKNVRFDVYV